MALERKPKGRFTGDNGSMLMLMPVAVLIMVVLAAITGDMTHLHIAKRDLIGVANSVANDAVTYGLDEEKLRNPNSAGDYPITPARVERAIAASLATHASTARGVYRLDQTQGNSGYIVGAEPDGSPSVTVYLLGTVHHVFAPALGDSPSVTLRATASARAARN